MNFLVPNYVGRIKFYHSETKLIQLALILSIICNILLVGIHFSGRFGTSTEIQNDSFECNNASVKALARVSKSDEKITMDTSHRLNLCLRDNWELNDQLELCEKSKMEILDSINFYRNQIDKSNNQLSDSLNGLVDSYTKNENSYSPGVCSNNIIEYLKFSNIK